MFEKVSRSLKYDSIFLVHKHVYMDTNTDHFTPLVFRVRGNESIQVVGKSEVIMTYNDQIKKIICDLFGN